MALGINSVNTNIFAQPATTVSGQELSKVAQEILSAKPVVPSINRTNQNVSKVDVSLYGMNASSNINAIKNAATNTAGFELNLSNQTLNSLSALNAKAAANLVNDVSNLRKGYIHIHSEQTDLSSLKEIYPFSNPPQVFETNNLSKDRRGSSPFKFVPLQEEKSEKTEGLSLIA